MKDCEYTDHLSDCKRFKKESSWIVFVFYVCTRHTYMRVMIVFESRNTRDSNGWCYNYVTNAAGLVYGIVYFNIMYAVHTHTHTHTHTCACADLQSHVRLSTDTEIYFCVPVIVSGVTGLRTAAGGNHSIPGLSTDVYLLSSIQTVPDAHPSFLSNGYLHYISVVKADNSPHLEHKNAWIYTFTALSVMECRVIKHSDCFTSELCSFSAV